MNKKTGNTVTPHGTTKLTYGSLSWNNYLKTAVNIGITEIEVKSVYSSPIGGGKGEYIDIDESIIEEVAAIFKPKLADLTPEQREIAELKAQMKELLEGKSAKKEAPKAAPKKDVESDDIEELRAEFKKLVGKKPHHKISRENLITEINKRK